MIRRRRQSAAARAASLRNLKKARSMNSKIHGGRKRRTVRRRRMVGGSAMRGGGIGDYISTLGSAFTKANHLFNRGRDYLHKTKIVSRGLKGLAIPVGAFRPAYGAALESAGNFADSYGYGKRRGVRRMRGGRRATSYTAPHHRNVYDSVGMLIR